MSNTQPSHPLHDALANTAMIAVPLTVLAAVAAMKSKNLKILAVETKALAGKIDAHNVRLDAHISQTAQQFAATNARADKLYEEPSQGRQRDEEAVSSWCWGWVVMWYFTRVQMCRMFCLEMFVCF